MKSKIENILIREDLERPETQVLTRFRSFSEIRTGAYSALMKLQKDHPKANIYYSCQDPRFKKSFLERNPLCREFNGEYIDLEITPSNYSPWELLKNIPNRITEDFDTVSKFGNWRNKISLKTESFQVVGKLKHLLIHAKATIYPGVVFDVTSGPIIIDQDVKITPFSFLEGPLYVGKGSHIDNAKIGGGTIIGSICKIGGEVENSILGDYSNKHHEGFVGHSVVGSWVNFGALATTSDLKNNYGNIKINVKKHNINTNTIKFGSLVGDFVKIGIGTMLNTGTVLDVGSNIVANRIQGYTPPFTWLTPPQKYRLDLFLNDARKIMARRDVILSLSLEELIRSVYES
jgi:glucose-1-phosphate thymidylyltransferase